MTLNVGDHAPNFQLPDENGNVHSLEEYAGRTVVLFFYPQDDTPGCIKEVCNFRDDFAKYEEAGAVLLGISPDDPNSHSKFKEKYNLPFTLLADEGHKISELYGVWGQKKLFALEYEGVIRTTYLINGSGKIAEKYNVTRIKQHSEAVLEGIRSLNPQ